MTEAANHEALRRIAAVTPVLTGIARAGDVLRLSEGELGHAGPPFASTADVPPVVLNALAGAVLHEGWAGTLVEAERLIRDGHIRLRPNHDLGTVSPMAGVVRPGQIVMCVADANGTGVTYATLAEAGRRALRFGVYGPDVAAGLRWLDAELGPAIARALPRDGLPVLPLIADGIRLGDDVHQRNVGGMLSFARALPELESPMRSWLLGNPQAFLNTAMAAAKLALDAAAGVASSRVVTAISRNGATCGIRMAGTGRRWFTVPASIPKVGSSRRTHRMTCNRISVTAPSWRPSGSAARSRTRRPNSPAQWDAPGKRRVRPGCACGRCSATATRRSRPCSWARRASGSGSTPRV